MPNEKQIAVISPNHNHAAELVLAAQPAGAAIAAYENTCDTKASSTALLPESLTSASCLIDEW